MQMENPARFVVMGEGVLLLLQNNWRSSTVKLFLQPMTDFTKQQSLIMWFHYLWQMSMIFQSIQNMFLDTGSPHHVAFVSTKKLDVPTEGALIAHNETYGEKGSNVNFVCVDSEDHITVRTFEEIS